MLHLIFPPITTLAASFLGGWCGSVPISVFIWALIHGHKPTPGPQPDPWFKISLAGIAGGILTGIIITGFSVNKDVISSDISILTSIVEGIIGGVIASSLVAAFTIKKSLNQNSIR